MNLKKLKDNFQTDQLAERALSQQEVWLLYEDGTIAIPIPKERFNMQEFIRSLKDRIQDLWGDPEVNVQWDPAEFNVWPEGKQMNIEIKDFLDPQITVSTGDIDIPLPLPV